MRVPYVRINNFFSFPKITPALTFRRSLLRKNL